MIENNPQDKDLTLESPERTAEAEKGAILGKILDRLADFRDVASKIYFKNKINEKVRDLSFESGSRASIPLVESVLGKEDGEKFDLKRASVRFSIGLITALKDTLEKTDESKINRDSKFGQIILACKTLLANPKIDRVTEELFAGQI